VLNTSGVPTEEPEADRHEGHFVGLWATEDDVRMIEAIKRWTHLKSTSAVLRLAITRAFRFLKDEEG
jgi:hypothetical protein